MTRRIVPRPFVLATGLLAAAVAIWLVWRGVPGAIARIERPAAPGTGAVVVVYALDPRSRSVSARRLRLIVGADRVAATRASSNSLPPLTLSDSGGQLGDCYLVTELSGPPGAPDRSSTSFAGCVWWWGG